MAATLIEPHRQSPLGHPTGCQVALNLRHTQRQQLCQLFRLLHAFGHHLHVQRPGQLHHGAHHDLVTPLQRNHKAAVNFDGMKRQRLQPVQRRLASAKVIQHEPEAPPVQVAHDRVNHMLGIGHQAFGDLQADGRGGQAVRGHCAHHIANEVGFRKLPHRQVDAACEVVPLGPQPRQQGTAFVQHLPAQRCDQPGFFCNGDELIGVDGFTIQRPAHQGFHAGHPVCHHVDHGLVHHLHRVVFHRAAQRLRQPGVTLGIGLQGFVKLIPAVAAFLFGLVHGQVGIAQPVSGVVGLARACNADGGGDGHLHIPVDQRQANTLQHLAGQGREMRRLCPVQHERELIAAHTGHLVASQHGHPQLPGHMAQQGIAHVVPEAIVDAFETIQIQQKQTEQRGGRFSIGLRIGSRSRSRTGTQRLVEQHHQPAPVEQPGERVVHGGVPGLLPDLGHQFVQRLAQAVNFVLPFVRPVHLQLGLGAKAVSQHGRCAQTPHHLALHQHIQGAYRHEGGQQQSQ